MRWSKATKTALEVQESIRRWWSLIHPSDRAVAQKYLLMVLEKSNSTLGAIILGLPEAKEVKMIRSWIPKEFPRELIELRSAARFKHPIST